MENIIDELYLGNVNPNENTRIRHPEYLSLSKQSVKLEEKICDMLTTEEKELFEEFVNTCCSMNALEVRLRFIEGFRLGAKIMLDVLTCPDIE